jgi:hypothetical protein
VGERIIADAIGLGVVRACRNKLRNTMSFVRVGDASMTTV